MLLVNSTLYKLHTTLLCVWIAHIRRRKSSNWHACKHINRITIITFIQEIIYEHIYHINIITIIQEHIYEHIHHINIIQAGYKRIYNIITIIQASLIHISSVQLLFSWFFFLSSRTNSTLILRPAKVVW